MKKLELFICFCSLFLISYVVVSAKDSNYVLKDEVIIIDPGHGGVDVGTFYHDIYEKEINLNLGLKLKEKLENKGASVIMTRDGDYDLASPDARRRKKSDFDNRINLINNNAGTLYLSIHTNYFDNAKYSGAQVFYLDNGEFAKIVQENLNKEFGFDRKPTKIKENYYMYSKLNIEGLLIECGFLSNSKDRANLTDDKYLEQFADNIVNSINEYKN